MKLKVLVDNHTYIDQYYCGEPALSYYIEDAEVRLLLDTGYSDLFLRNAAAFGLDLKNLNAIVLSHGHNDHTGGLAHYLMENQAQAISVVAHPDAFQEKTLNGLSIGSPISAAVLKERCKLVLTKKPIKISKNIMFLGEIPQTFPFESRKPIGCKKVGNSIVADYVMDDTALVYQSVDGIYIITGCSHSGICNIIAYAKDICKDNRVLGIIGGLHLSEINVQVHETIAYMKQQHITEFYPCHCTAFPVRAEMWKHFPVTEVGVGLEIEW